MLSSSHVLVGMLQDSEFYVAACDSTQTAFSDSLGILAYRLDCPSGLWTVTVWLAETGIEIPELLDVFPWALLSLPLWWL